MINHLDPLDHFSIECDRAESIRTLDPIAFLEASQQEEEQLRREIDYPSDGNRISSNEDFTAYMSGSSFMQKLSQFVGKLKDSISNFISNVLAKFRSDKSPVLTDSKFFLNIQRYADETKYFDIARSVKLITLMKLSAKWLDYSRYLLTLVERVVKVDEDIIAPAQEYFAQIISEPTKLQSILFKPKMKTMNIDSVRKEMSGYFAGGKRDKITWGEAFERNADVKEIIALLGKMKETFSKLPPETVKSTMEVLLERAKVVSDGIGNNTSPYNLNKKQAKQLGDVLFAVAQHIELYAVAYQLYADFAAILKTNSDNLKFE